VEKVNPQQALSEIINLLSTIKLTKAEHIYIERCCNALVEVVQAAQPKPEDSAAALQ
jgi:hypothetical protein